MKIVRAVVLSLSFVSLAAIAFATICVSDGTSVTISDTRPTSPPGSSTSTWMGGAVMVEDDGDSFDDFMGNGTIGPGGVTTGTVTNSGGDLFGVFGGDQNGIGEGACIEVQFCWSYREWIPVSSHYVMGPDGWFHRISVGGYWMLRSTCSTPQEVCPAGWSPC